MEVMKAMTLDYTWERREELIRKEEWEDGRLEGRREGINQGTSYKLMELVCKKLRRHKSVSEIAEDLEEDEGFIQKMYNVAEKYAPEYDVDKVMEEWFENK
jgi:predicted transposase YdaD